MSNRLLKIVDNQIGFLEGISFAMRLHRPGYKTCWGFVWHGMLKLFSRAESTRSTSARFVVTK